MARRVWRPYPLRGHISFVGSTQYAGCGLSLGRIVCRKVLEPSDFRNIEREHPGSASYLTVPRVVVQYLA